MLDVARELARGLGKDIQPEIVNKFRAGDIRHCVSDIALARELLGFEPKMRVRRRHAGAARLGGDAAGDGHGRLGVAGARGCRPHAVSVAPDISISLVNTDNRDLLLACLESLPGAAEGITLQTIVIDNASTDGSAAAVREALPGRRGGRARAAPRLRRQPQRGDPPVDRAATC